MGNANPKLAKLGVNLDQPIGKEQFLKLWSNYSEKTGEYQNKMTYVSAHKFLKDFAAAAGVTYHEYLAEAVISNCDVLHSGYLTLDQFENLFYHSAHRSNLVLTHSVIKTAPKEDSKRVFKQDLVPLDATLQSDGEFSICFPSISTSAYQYDVDRAATVATQVIKEFLLSHTNQQLRLYLVDITDSPTLAAFRKKREEEIDDPRYIIKQANLTLLRDHGIQSWYLVNASNPSFHGQGSGTNRAIHMASNSNSFNLEKETRRIYSKTAKTAKAYPVTLPAGSPLRDYQGVKTVIHVVGPNMSPKRPRYLGNDYARGDKLLRRAYRSIFKTFYKLTELQPKDPESESSSIEFDKKGFFNLE
eukprot:TRINITY_DN13602_c0_g1_i1.p1 TRINITY_DN13602_c0_g1~~TRINITY_DN13602_c0_g1_i1.p1  ORF type:complete len:359 (+),score=72.65 TRINITY_DN13602_c0_g1_i1:332-1408(+)